MPYRRHTRDGPTAAAAAAPACSVPEFKLFYCAVPRLGALAATHPDFAEHRRYWRGYQRTNGLNSSWTLQRLTDS